MLERWFSTVETLMNSCPATCLSDRRAATSSGDAQLAGGQRARGRRAAPADPAQLAGRGLRPAGAAEPLERRASLFERLPGRRSLLGAALASSQRQQRAGS